MRRKSSKKKKQKNNSSKKAAKVRAQIYGGNAGLYGHNNAGIKSTMSTKNAVASTSYSMFS